MGKIIKEIIHEYKAIFYNLKKCKRQRKEYKIKPFVGFYCSRNLFTFSILPVIIWSPWIYRHPGWCVVEINWFNFVISIGKWEHVSETRGDG